MKTILPVPVEGNETQNTPINSTFYLNIKVEGVALVIWLFSPHLYFIFSYYSFFEQHFLEC